MPDLVIADLADENARLRDEVAILGVESDSYRALAQQAIHALHEETRQHGLTRAQLRRERDQHRHVRTQIMTKAAAA